MERKYLKAVNFDLSVHELEKHYSDYRKAYYDIKRFLRNRDLNTDRVQAVSYTHLTLPTIRLV